MSTPLYNSVAVHYLGNLTDQYEFTGMTNHFDCYPYMSSIPKGSLVVPRYTVQPYNLETYYGELKSLELTPINSIAQHNIVADIRNWYPLLKSFTPKTWFSHEFSQINPLDGPFVVRGIEKSRKDNWDSKMYATHKRAAIEIVADLYQDTGPGFSDCVIREYIPLKHYGTGVNGMPITQEYRVFIFKNQIQYYAPYWCNYTELLDLEEMLAPAEVTSLLDFVKTVMYVSELDLKVNWFSIDVAKTAKNCWVVIEVNDGQRSGVPVILDPNEGYDTFYRSIRRILGE
jgi:hypothetical protein